MNEFHASRSVSPPAEEPYGAESGFMLVAVVVMVALVLIALSVAAPVIAKSVRRDKEVETEHRAEQYVRAIRLYYRKFHAYPPSIDALKQTSNVRFLRQEYVDPLSGKADWKIIHLGEQKTTVKGFFGQELGGIGAGGLGSSPGSGLGSASGMNSGIGTPIGGASSAGSGFGSGAASSSLGGGSTINSTSALGSGFLGASTGSTPGGAPGASGASGSTDSSGGLGGGGVIVGVAPGVSGSSILTPNQQTTYESWEFWYDPRIEQMYQKGQMNMGAGSGTLSSQPASSFGTGLSGQPNSGSSSILGSSGTGAGAGSTPTTPSSPNSPF